MKPQIVRANYKFEAAHNDEISVDAGDLLVVTGNVNEDWFIGYNLVDSFTSSAYASGRFPTNYCSTVVRPSVDEFTAVFLAIHDVATGIPGDLLLWKADIVVGDKKLSKTHWNGHKLLARFDDYAETGLFSEENAVRLDLNAYSFAGEEQATAIEDFNAAGSESDYINFTSVSQSNASSSGPAPAPAESVQSSEASIGTAVCTVPSTAQIEDELSLAIGDVVTVVRRVDDVYFFGRKLNKPQAGIFPAHCIQFQISKDSTMTKQPDLPKVQEKQPSSNPAPSKLPPNGAALLLSATATNAALFQASLMSGLTEKRTNAPPPVSAKPKVSLNELREQQRAAKALASASASAPMNRATSSMTDMSHQIANASTNSFTSPNLNSIASSLATKPLEVNSVAVRAGRSSLGPPSGNEPPARPPPIAVLPLPKVVAPNASDSGSDTSSSTSGFSSRINVPLPQLPANDTKRKGGAQPPAPLDEHNRNEIYDEIDHLNQLINQESPGCVDANVSGDTVVEKQEKMARTYKFVVQEILETEQRYLLEMSAIARVFIGSPAILSFDESEGTVVMPRAPKSVDATKLFGNLDEVVGVSDILLKSLLTVVVEGEGQSVTSGSTQQSVFMVGECFNNQMREICNAYGRYCRDHEEAIQLIDKYKSVPEAQRYIQVGLERVKQLIIAGGSGSGSSSMVLELQSMLIKPVQRVLRYPLLLKELLKNTFETHPDRANLVRAVEEMDGVAAQINEQKRCADLVSRYREESGDSIGDKLARFNTHTLKKKSSRAVQRMQEQLGLSHGVQDGEFNELEARFRSIQATIRNFSNSLKDKLRVSGELGEAKKEMLMKFLRLYRVPLMNDRLRFSSANNGNENTLTRQSLAVRNSTADASLNDPRLALVCDMQKTVAQISENFSSFIKRVESEVLAPVENLESLFSVPSRLMRKRADKKRDYDYACSQSHQKDQVEPLFKTYSALNLQLKTELPLLINASESLMRQCFVRYIDLCVEFNAFAVARYDAVWSESPACSKFVGTSTVRSNDIISACVSDQQSVSTRQNALISAISGAAVQQESWPSTSSSSTLHRASSAVPTTVSFSTRQNVATIRKQSVPVAMPLGNTVPRNSTLSALIQVKQTREHREQLTDKYQMSLMYIVTQDTSGHQTSELDLQVSKDDWVAMIKDGDPTGNRERCFVDSGIAKGFVARNILMPMDTALTIMRRRGSSPNPAASTQPTPSNDAAAAPAPAPPLPPKPADSNGSRPQGIDQVDAQARTLQNLQLRRGSAMPAGELCYTSDEYTARTRFELSLAKNQPIYVIRKSDDRGDDTWWLVQDESGRQGYVSKDVVVKR